MLTGPRRSGKTFLLRRLLPRASYFLLEDPDVVARLRADPQGFLDAVTTPAILDEVQNVPEVLALVRSRIDRSPRRKGQWLLTGSQEAPLMRGVTESMAGRAAVLQLLPLSARESARVTLLRGGAPGMLLVHQPARGGVRTTAVAPGVRAVPWPELVGELERSGPPVREAPRSG